MKEVETWIQEKYCRVLVWHSLFSADSARARSASQAAALRERTLPHLSMFSLSCPLPFAPWPEQAGRKRNAKNDLPSCLFPTILCNIRHVPAKNGHKSCTVLTGAVRD